MRWTPITRTAVNRFQFFIVGDSEDAVGLRSTISKNLRTAAILDFEYLEEHALTIRVEDPYGGSLEQEFVIEVVDAFIPIVETDVPEVGVDGLVTLRGAGIGPGWHTGNSGNRFFVESLRDSRLNDRRSNGSRHHSTKTGIFIHFSARSGR